MELDTSTIGKRIAQKREKLHLTQSQLAEMVNISDRHVSSIETGKSPSSLPVFTDIAIVLDTTLDYLVLGKPEPKFAMLSNELYEKISNFSKEQIELLNLFIKALESK